MKLLLCIIEYQLDTQIPLLRPVESVLNEVVLGGRGRRSRRVQPRHQLDDDARGFRTVMELQRMAIMFQPGEHVHEDSAVIGELMDQYSRVEQFVAEGKARRTGVRTLWAEALEEPREKAILRFRRSMLADGAILEGATDFGITVDLKVKERVEATVRLGPMTDEQIQTEFLLFDDEVQAPGRVPDLAPLSLFVDVDYYTVGESRAVSRGRLERDIVDGLAYAQSRHRMIAGQYFGRDE